MRHGVRRITSSHRRRLPYSRSRALWTLILIVSASSGTVKRKSCVPSSSPRLLKQGLLLVSRQPRPLLLLRLAQPLQPLLLSLIVVIQLTRMARSTTGQIRVRDRQRRSPRTMVMTMTITMMGMMERTGWLLRSLHMSRVTRRMPVALLSWLLLLLSPPLIALRLLRSPPPLHQQHLLQRVPPIIAVT